MSSFSHQIDPHDVLGVGRDASLEQIRDAYRLKSKRYHPDAGGEDWAFRIVVRAYETLSHARVLKAAQSEFKARPTPRAPAGWNFETVRPGVRDRAVDPRRIVAVETLWIRYEADFLWFDTSAPAEDRFLSCNLNLAWPDPALPALDLTDAETSGVMQSLGKIFETLRARTSPATARCQAEGRQFSAWLSYPDIERATAALDRFKAELHNHHLGIKQWTRDLIIPSDWR